VKHKILSENQSSKNMISGDRFKVVYKIKGDKELALSRANDICYEQTVEFPPDITPEGFINDNIVGRIESFEPVEKDTFHATISFANEVATSELTQLLNVIYGNISIKPGIYVESIDFNENLLKPFKGPRFGIHKFREYLAINNRPILCTALKPMGLTTKGLSELAYLFAKGGIDIIKDDHGIANQPFSKFEERVIECTKSINKANKETGFNCIYAPNITAPFSEIINRAKFAKEAGAGALLISPGLTGFDAMRTIAEDDSIGLPILSHPAFLGSYLINENGISHFALLGQLMRISGADATIYPNFGGRFSFSILECENIIKGAYTSMFHIKPCFPTPGGGMDYKNIHLMQKVYGTDVIYLIGGGLFKYSEDIVKNAQQFKEACV
jgi:ribulose-bisphosphate carboxylase large chain